MGRNVTISISDGNSGAVFHLSVLGTRQKNLTVRQYQVILPRPAWFIYTSLKLC